MTDDPTCGEGLAEHSALPAKLAELTASLAENLEVHTKALDRTDEIAEREYGVYLKLVQEHRKIAALLQATAEEMAASRDFTRSCSPRWADSAGPAAKRAYDFLNSASYEVTRARRCSHDWALCGACCRSRVHGP